MTTWGKINREGELVGELTTFPPMVGLGERLTFKMELRHNTGECPNKVFLQRTEPIGDARCLATFDPQSPRGKWTITAWADYDRAVLSIVQATLRELGLA